jgi:tight adherence protein B
VSRPLFILAAVGIAALSAVTATALGADKARVTETATQGFPSRSYVLTLPRGMKLPPGSAQVLENGQPIDGLTVTPVGESSDNQFGVVLAIDASTSMEGDPERAAFAAARAFAAQRKGEEQLAIVTYNVVPSVALPLTAEQADIDAALAKQPPFLFGTHIYDAVKRSLDLLGEAHIKAGTIVLLSDGQEHHGEGDTVGHETETRVAAMARAKHVRVFAVGLRSRVSELAALRTLARDTGGGYLEATSIKRLRSIYKQLGSTLASEYLLRYRSLADPNKRIVVTVKVKGVEGVATTEYRAPALPIATSTPAAPYEPSIVNRVLESASLTAIVALIVAGLVGWGAAAVTGGERPGTVRKRLAEFVSVPSAIRDRGKRPTSQLTDKMFEGTESMFRGSSRWDKFKWELQIAKVSMPPEQIVVLTAVCSLLAFLLVEYVVGSLLVAFAIAAAIPLGVRSFLKRQLLRQRKLFSEQLPDNLQVLASALRAGHSFVGALSVVVNDAPEPARTEFQRVLADEQLGVPIDQALHVVAERMESRELEQVALVAALQRETGGNTAEVLDRVTDTIRERFELRRSVQTLTAQGRMSRWVLTALPLVLLLVITVINPGYMSIMYHTQTGRILMVLGAISVTAGSFVIKRIVNIRV